MPEGRRPKTGGENSFLAVDAFETLIHRLAVETGQGDLFGRSEMTHLQPQLRSGLGQQLPQKLSLGK